MSLLPAFSISSKVPRSDVSEGKTLSIKKKKNTNPKQLCTDKNQECAYFIWEPYCGCHGPDALLVETGPTLLTSEELRSRESDPGLPMCA